MPLLSRRPTLHRILAVQAVETLVAALAVQALVAALTFGLLLAAPTVAAAEKPLVILLSWDGVRHDYPERSELPGLERLAAEGLRASGLQPVFPTSTFPNHVSLATGTYPDRHGIVENVFYDGERGEIFNYDNGADWIEAEPLWAAAERQGLRAAVFFWVGSETDWNGVGASYRKAPFDSGVGEAEKVRQILAWMDLPETQRPSLIMSWWHGADRSGHLKGPDSDDVARDLVAQDVFLVELLAGIDARDRWADTTLLVVSDHGMTELGEPIVPRDVLEEAGVAARLVVHESTVNVFLDRAEDVGTAEAALAAVEGVSVHRRNAIPHSLRIAYPNRLGDLVGITGPPRYFSEADASAWFQDALAWLFGWQRGSHGFSTAHPDMPGIFYAAGRGIPRLAEPVTLRTIDVAPTVAHLLGIDPPADSEGQALGALAEGPPAN